MKRPKISVVVPTCDRPELLQHTIRGLLLSSYRDCEIIVSDNFCSPETRNVVEGFSDQRLRYIRTPSRLGLCDHWEFAFRHVIGDYFIYNGDDDGLAPSLFERLDEMVDQGYKLISWLTALYFHPDWEHDEGGNVLQFGRNVSGDTAPISINKVLQRYCQLDRSFFPESTRMCCSTELARRVIRRTGRIFWPLSVDLTSSLLLLGELQDGDYLYLDDYVGYGGRSKVSNAAAYERCIRTGEGGEIDRADSFYKEHGEIDFWPWHPLKTRAYWNGHAAAWSLFMHWHCSTNQPGTSLHWTELMGRMLAEVYGISNANPFLSDADLRNIHRFIWTFSREDIRNIFGTCLGVCTKPMSTAQDAFDKTNKFPEVAPQRPDRDSVISDHQLFTRDLITRLDGFNQGSSLPSRLEVSTGFWLINGSLMAYCDQFGIGNSFELAREFHAIFDQAKMIMQQR